MAKKKTLEDQINDMISTLTEAKNEAVKADAGNASAGRRLRAEMAKIPKMIKAAKAQSLGKE
jgi:hypothetical protein